MFIDFHIIFFTNAKSVLVDKKENENEVPAKVYNPHYSKLRKKKTAYIKIILSKYCNHHWGPYSKKRVINF